MRIYDEIRSMLAVALTPVCPFPSGRAVHDTGPGAQQRHGGAVQPRPPGANGQHADGPEAAVRLWTGIRPQVRALGSHAPPVGGGFAGDFRCD